MPDPRLHRVSHARASTATCSILCGASLVLSAAVGCGGAGAGPGPVPVVPPDPAPGPAGTVSFTLDSSKDVHPISRFIYGYNASSPSQAARGATLLRSGGNRWTAYDWVNNASNAGIDFQFNSDDYLGGGTTPGEAIRPIIAAARAAGLATLITVPLQGWVAADKLGAVPLDSVLTDRFVVSRPRKGAPFTLTPDLSGHAVYQDEFLNFLATRFPGALGDANAPLWLSLDNEPDLWADTHKEIQRAALTYRQLEDLSIAMASALKDRSPEAVLFGPASYGFAGFVNLQGATDSTGSEWFLDHYLRTLRIEGEAQHRRLLDVLDLHWYPEATGGGTRIIEAGNSAALQEARVQAPRSLWDPTYRETSWIADYLGKPIALLPAVRAKIAANYPGTRLAISEYNYGGPADVSGAVAEADVLGIFGREGVFAATFWPLAQDNRFIDGAFRMYRDLDGNGASFGDTSFQAQSSDNSVASIYASLDSGRPDRVVLVAVNRATSATDTSVRLTHGAALSVAHVTQLTAASALPQPAADVPVAQNAFALRLPARSVTSVVLVR